MYFVEFFDLEKMLVSGVLVSYYNDERSRGFVAWVFDLTWRGFILLVNIFMLNVSLSHHHESYL